MNASTGITTSLGSFPISQTTKFDQLTPDQQKVWIKLIDELNSKLFCSLEEFKMNSATFIKPNLWEDFAPRSQVISRALEYALENGQLSRVPDVINKMGHNVSLDLIKNSSVRFLFESSTSGRTRFPPPLDTPVYSTSIPTDLSILHEKLALLEKENRQMKQEKSEDLRKIIELTHQLEILQMTNKNLQRQINGIISQSSNISAKQSKITSTSTSHEETWASFVYDLNEMILSEDGNEEFVDYIKNYPGLTREKLTWLGLSESLKIALFLDHMEKKDRKLVNQFYLALQSLSNVEGRKSAKAIAKKALEAIDKSPIKYKFLGEY